MLVYETTILATTYGEGTYGTQGVYSDNSTTTNSTSNTASPTGTANATPTSNTTSNTTNSTTNTTTPTQNYTVQPTTNNTTTTPKSSHWGLWISIIVTVIALGVLTFIILGIRKRRKDKDNVVGGGDNNTFVG